MTNPFYTPCDHYPPGVSGNDYDDYCNPKVHCTKCDILLPADQMTWRPVKFKEPVPYCPTCINIINSEV